MLHRARRATRPIAAVLAVALAAVVSAECIPDGRITAGEHACCAAMEMNCHATVEQGCCSPQSPQVAQTLAVKPVTVAPPIAAVAALTMSPASVGAGTAAVRAVVSASPPGVPTYVLVSSFRI
mgnify:CR=1 FL=1